jgi:hypothetical protein
MHHVSRIASAGRLTEFGVAPGVTCRRHPYARSPRNGILNKRGGHTNRSKAGVPPAASHGVPRRPFRSSGTSPVILIVLDRTSSQSPGEGRRKPNASRDRSRVVLGGPKRIKRIICRTHPGSGIASCTVSAGGHSDGRPIDFSRSVSIRVPSGFLPGSIRVPSRNPPGSRDQPTGASRASDCLRIS